MALITAGYWHSNYWLSRYWHEDYWLKSTVPTPPSTGWILKQHVTVQKPRFPRSLLIALKEMIEAETY